MDTEKTAKIVNGMWDDSIIPTLCDYIRIPNKSPNFDADWENHGHMERAVRLLEDWCRRQPIDGMSVEIVRIEGRTPVLFIEIPGDSEDVVLLYGHYDKQPEFTGWADGLEPWQPTIRDGKLYGRGGADDGYAVFGSLAAIRSLSLVVCLDAECGNYDQLWCTTSLRGNLVGTLSVEVLTEGVHSGGASGIVPSSFRLLRGLLSRIEDQATGRLTIDALHDEIPVDRQQQAKRAADVLGNSVYTKFPWVDLSSEPNESAYELVLNNTWRPTLAVTGADGLPALRNAGNVLLPGTTLKLSFRLPPTSDPAAAAAAVQACLEKDPPAFSRVRFRTESAMGGWNAPAVADWLAVSMQEASQAFFSRPSMYMGTGGSIPFMGMLGEKFPEAQFLVTGLLGPNSNAHGPNEFLHIATGKRLTACVARVLADHFRR
jgi:acetylornithine deacetylase/succinyl-diaminopimelate desuccinylase-like protein